MKTTYMRVISKTTSLMAKDSLITQTAASIKDHSKMADFMDMDSFNGQMAHSIEATI